MTVYSLPEILFKIKYVFNRGVSQSLRWAYAGGVSPTFVSGSCRSEGQGHRCKWTSLAYQGRKCWLLQSRDCVFMSRMSCACRRSRQALNAKKREAACPLFCSALADSGLWLEDSQVQLLHSLHPCCYSLGGLKDGVQWGYCTCINLVKNYNGFVKCYVGPLLTSGPLQGSFLSLHWFTVSSTWLTHHLFSPVYISSYCGSWSSSVHHDLLECLRYPGLLDMLGLNGRETFPQETLDSEGLPTGSYCMHCVTKELEAYTV